MRDCRYTVLMISAAMPGGQQGVAEDEYAANYAALASLYGEWAHGTPARFALVAGGIVHGVYPTLAEARRGVQALPQGLNHALVAALWPLDGWRHPRLAVDSHRRLGSAPPATMEAQDPGARDFLLAEQLRRDSPTPEDLSRPYALIKDGAVLGRFRRVTQARQVVDAALPPLAPVLFTSLRPGWIAPFTIMVLQALVERYNQLPQFDPRALRAVSTHSR
jgi:hypothetical protein